MPITPIAGKSGCFYREHGAGGASANGGQQFIEPGPRRPAAGTPEVVVDDYYVRPPKRPRACRESILTATTLRIVCELVRGGLPHIHKGGARGVFNANLAHRSPPLLPPRPGRTRLAEARAIW